MRRKRLRLPLGEGYVSELNLLTLAGRVHVLYDREEGTFLSRALLVLDKVGASQQYEQSGPPGLQITLDPVREGVL